MKEGAAISAFGAVTTRALGVPALALAAVLLLLLPAPVLAQGSAALPYSTNGVNVGGGRLHVFTDVEARYDSAAGFFPSSGAPGTELALQGELIWHFRPGLRLELPGSDVDFQVGGNLDYLLYSGLLTPGSGAASRLQAAADLGLTLNKDGVIELRLTDTFRRNDKTSNVALGFAVLSLANLVNLSVPIRPGGGALEITPGANYGLELFTPIATGPVGACGDPTCDPSTVSQYNSQTAGGSLVARWNFLPRTTIIFDNAFGYTFYPEGGSTSSSILRSTLGIAGLLTQKLSVNAKAGWAHNFGALGGSTFVGQAELSYPLTTTSLVSGGYLRNVQPVSVYGTVVNDRVYANGKFLLASRLAVAAEVGYDWLGFEAGSNRVDHVLSASLSPQYEILPWMLAGAGYQLSLRDSSSVSAQSVNFARHEGYLRLTLRY